MKVATLTAGLAASMLGACSGTYKIDEAGGVFVSPDPVFAQVGDYDGERFRPTGRIRIPDGQLPPPGECRVWYMDRPAGQQPPPTSCAVRVPPGAVLIRG